MNIRLLDILISLIGLTVLSPILILIFFLGLLDTGSPLFFQKRLGRGKLPFTLIKFRTMRKSTANLPSHLTSISCITSFGKLLRRSKLDELPQLWNVLKGDMSLVGPRPGLLTQKELTEARERLGVYSVRPGITGLAQINGVDMSTPEKLAKVDSQMVSKLNIKIYLGYILLTLKGNGAGDAVK